MRVLVFCSDRFHSAATVRMGLAGLANTGEFIFDWVEDASSWDPANLGHYAVALLSKSNALSEHDHRPWLYRPTETLFATFVASGGGLLAVHSGIASYQDVAPVRAVLGGVFVSHPPPTEVTLEPLPRHPLTVGIVAPFVVHDEHYQVALDDPQADVFLHSRSLAGRQPAGWTRAAGEGRVCVLTPGHFHEVWCHVSFQALLVNALRWVGATRLPR